MALKAGRVGVAPSQVDLQGNVKAGLSPEQSAKLDRALLAPITTPLEKEIVGVGTANEQIMFKLGDGISVTGETSPFTLGVSSGGWTNIYNQPTGSPAPSFNFERGKHYRFRWSVFDPSSSIHVKKEDYFYIPGDSTGAIRTSFVCAYNATDGLHFYVLQVGMNGSNDLKIATLANHYIVSASGVTKSSETPSFIMSVDVEN